MGARTVFCAGALIFGAGALTCALAPSMGQIVAGRFVQGFGGGLLTAMAYVLVRNTFPESLWARGFALLSGAWSLSILVGPLVGGVFARYGDWRGAFFAVAALACVLALVALRALPRSLSSRAGARVPALRVALICTAIAAMSLTAIVPQALAKAGLFAGAIAALALTVLVDRRAAKPCCRPTPFRCTARPASACGSPCWSPSPTARCRSSCRSSCRACTASIRWARATWWPAPRSAGRGCPLIVAGTPPERTDRLLVAGPVMMALGLLGVALLMPLEPAPIVFPAIALTGAGIGSCWAFIAQRVMSGARAGEEDIAASSVATVQQTGFALGAALAGLAANAAGLSAGLNRTDIASAAFWVPTSFVLAALAAIVMGARLAGRRGRAAAG